MANEIKITKKMYLSALANLIKSLEEKGEEITLENGITPEMAVGYCEHEIELLNKKNATKSVSKKDLEKKNKDKELQTSILNSMKVGKKYNCASIREICPDVADYATISASKLSYLLTDLIKEGALVREEIKRVPHYSLATTNEAEG